jgi:hypothetical protein
MSGERQQIKKAVAQHIRSLRVAWALSLGALGLLSAGAWPHTTAAEPPKDEAPAPKPPRWQRVTLHSFGISLELHPRMAVEGDDPELFVAVGQRTGFSVLVLSVPGSNHLTFEDMLWPLRAITDLNVIDYDTFTVRKFPDGIKGQTLICRAKIAGELMKVGVVAVPWPEQNRTALVYTVYRPDSGNDGTERRTLNSIKLSR